MLKKLLSKSSLISAFTGKKRTALNAPRRQTMQDMVLLINVQRCLAVHQFIRSIDCNNDDTYLSAVNTIKVKYANDGTALSENEIRKLLFRFPNLQQVEISQYLCMDFFRLNLTLDQERYERVFNLLASIDFGRHGFQMHYRMC